MVAGLNAGLLAGGGRAAFRLDRSEAYIGVLIDDLVSRGVSEPYRMFTSRAEYRLRLRADNADQRLTGKGVRLGCVSRRRAAAFQKKTAALDGGRALLHGLSATPDALARHGLAVKRDGVRRSAFDLLRYPDVDMAALRRIWPELGAVRADVVTQLETDARYAGYLERQEADIHAFRRDEALALPQALDYDAVAGLSNEARDVLKQARPESLGAAARLSGMTPAALLAVLAHVRRPGARKQARESAA